MRRVKALAGRGEVLPASLAEREKRIHIALQRQGEQDEVIAEELRGAKEDLNNLAAWLEWCSSKFGWGRRRAFERLKPERVRSKRAKDRAGRAARASRPGSEKAASSTEKVHDSCTGPRRPAEFKNFDLARRMVKAGFRALSMIEHPDKGGSLVPIDDLKRAEAWLNETIKTSEDLS